MEAGNMRQSGNLLNGVQVETPQMTRAAILSTITEEMEPWLLLKIHFNKRFKYKSKYLKVYLIWG